MCNCSCVLRYLENTHIYTIHMFQQGGGKRLGTNQYRQYEKASDASVSLVFNNKKGAFFYVLEFLGSQGLFPHTSTSKTIQLSVRIFKNIDSELRGMQAKWYLLQCSSHISNIPNFTLQITIHFHCPGLPQSKLHPNSH